MIHRLLALFNLALISRSDAALLAGVKGCDACVVHKIPQQDGNLYIVIVVKPLTDEEAMKAMGVKEG